MSEGTTMLEQVNNIIGRILIFGEENTWDYGFLQSIADQLNKGRTLSSAQEATIQQVQGRWSDEAIKARADFTKDWNEEKEEKFLIALCYYRVAGYYSNIVGKYLTINMNGDYAVKGVPSMKEYNKLVENKYASAVIRNLKEEPKFAAGSAAVFRANANPRRYRGKTCVILRHGDVAKVSSHAKGAKPVQVLVIGEAQPVWTEERFLKKVKKRK